MQSHFVELTGCSEVNFLSLVLYEFHATLVQVFWFVRMLKMLQLSRIRSVSQAATSGRK